MEKVPIQPSEHHEYLQRLRELFRERMEREDFCLGGEQVEKLFRELLGEAEPERPVYSQDNTSRISAADVAQIFEEQLKGKLTTIFDRDDAFYTHMRKR